MSKGLRLFRLKRSMKRIDPLKKQSCLNLKVLTCPEWFKNRLGEVWVCLLK